jgi:hypothetical protein
MELCVDRSSSSRCKCRFSVSYALPTDRLDREVMNGIIILATTWSNANRQHGKGPDRQSTWLSPHQRKGPMLHNLITNDAIVDFRLPKWASVY